MIMKRILAYAAIIASAAFLTGCGFTPLHADLPNKTGASLSGMSLDFVETESQGARGDRLEFLLTQSLKNRMGSASASNPYILELSPKLTRSGIGVRQDDVATRVDLILYVDYVIRDAATGDEIDRGDVTAISTYSAPNNPYTVSAALEDAEERVAREAADRLIFDVARALKK